MTNPEPLAVALAAAHEAGAILLEGFGASPPAPLLGRRHRAATKSSDIDLVTDFDRRSEALIVARLGAAFPADLIVAEEASADADGAARPATAAARWLIDPIDGTTNFAHGLPFFCVSIAREVHGRVEVGVVYAPALGLCFACAAGQGATLNGERITVSDERDLAGSLLATGFPYDRHTSPHANFEQFVALQRRARGVRRFGSAALDLCLVAAGRFDGYWEMKLKPWDLAAGALMVEEAGGRVTGWRGEPVALDRGAAVASNALIHDSLLAALATLPIPPPAL